MRDSGRVADRAGIQVERALERREHRFGRPEGWPPVNKSPFRGAAVTEKGAALGLGEVSRDQACGVRGTVSTVRRMDASLANNLAFRRVCDSPTDAS